MSRQQSQGVVLTGYHSNAELLPKTGPRAAVCVPALDPEPTAPRWDIWVCVAVVSRFEMWAIKGVCVCERERAKVNDGVIFLIFELQSFCVVECSEFNSGTWLTAPRPRHVGDNSALVLGFLMFFLYHIP